MSTVKSPRVLVKIDEITVKRGSGDDAKQEPVVVKMKASHAKFLGIEALDGDDPILQGKFAGTEGNGGYRYLRNLGGFRARAYTLIAKSSFAMEETPTLVLGVPTTIPRSFKSISIGFPSGVKVIEVYNWLRGLDDSVTGKIGYIRTPAGRKVDFTTVDNSPAAPAPDLGEPGQPALTAEP
jgi:hypothetical protein